MKKVDYATVNINVKVDEERIEDLREELAISDELVEIANELERWLNTKSSPFEFKVELQ